MSELEMVCPKCRGVMRSYERSGVVIEQCNDCRGIFLDRGELERLADAETAHYRNANPPPPAPTHSAGAGTGDIVKAVVQAATASSGGKKGTKGFLSQLLS